MPKIILLSLCDNSDYRIFSEFSQYIFALFSELLIIRKGVIL